ncbi:flagellar biosynthesis anti-sigma factor FlgM [Aquabacterium sp.]|uniref:flagellar biosynthesis anti-sigma factor FlgM n=1 Tax=Aquabacterium sp. TaxID=1872578 RepID=UPI002BFCB6C2|nr:flagellar biosynthesis anti-sigma factor FlgM [Aquabacterium sp.]HSW05106.1 flagellar biosynthesis anti-sigma factor FlgM [Aquabacterium sp.]
MKIGSIENKPAVSPAVTERKSTTAAAGGGSASEPSAKVELSAGALLGAGGSEAVFDAEKVKRISDAIRDGKFEVNAEAIADKLIANAAELLSPKARS